MTAAPGRRDATQEAIAALRASPVRQRRHLSQGLRDAGADLAEGIVELVLLLVGCAVAGAVRWGWQHSALITVTVIVVVAGAEAFGVFQPFRAIRRRRGVRRLPAVALGLAVVAGWGAGSWLFYAGW